MTVRVDGLAAAVPSSLPLELRGRSLIVARVIWGALIVLAAFLSVLSVPAEYARLRHPPAEIRGQLARAGLSATVYATYLTTIGIIFALVCCAMAALIAWHRSHDRIGLFASLCLALLGLITPPAMQAVVAGHPALTVPASFASYVPTWFLVAFFFLFPDGRVVPCWSRLPLLLSAAGVTALFFVTGATAANPPGWSAFMILVGTATGITAQVYRYIRVSDVVQHQQTKWVLLGVAGAIVTALVFGFGGPLIPSIGRADIGYGLTGVTTVTIAFLFIPLTLGFAILHYRLWDIDIVINRTLVYGALTVGLLGLYHAVADGLGALIQARGRLPVVFLATALVAVLFAPLRNRLQSAVNRLMYGERDDPYRVLTRLGERIGAALAPEAVLAAIGETVANALKASHVAITLKQANSLIRAASRGPSAGVPLRLPLEYQGESVGELLVAPRGPGEEFSAADRRLLEDLARQIGPAAQAVRLTADLQRSRERLVTAREEERRRLRRDLHDGLGPQLAALTLKIETIRNRFAHDRELDDALVDLTARTQAALSDIRRLIYGLRPPALDELGLLPAIQQTAMQYSEQGAGALQITVEAPESLPPLPAAVEVATYRIVQEALANVVRHAGARTCQIALSLEDERDLLHLRIADDGHGLPVRPRAGVGLRSMRERAEELGGHWTITSPVSGGTVVVVELPCAPTDQPGAATGMEGQNGTDSHPDCR